MSQVVNIFVYDEISFDEHTVRAAEYNLVLCDTIEVCDSLRIAKAHITVNRTLRTWFCGYPFRTLSDELALLARQQAICREYRL